MWVRIPNFQEKNWSIKSQFWRRKRLKFSPDNCKNNRNARTKKVSKKYDHLGYQSHHNLFELLGMKFLKRFSDRWTVEAFVHEEGNEIGLIGQFWPNPVSHFKLELNREIDLILSVKHEIAKNEECLPDAKFLDFSKCFRTKFKNIFVNSDSSRMFCEDCRNENVSVCATVWMKYFFEPGKDLPFCYKTESNRCSAKCFYSLIR